MSYSIPIIFYGIPLVVNDDLDRTETVDQLIDAVRQLESER